MPASRSRTDHWLDCLHKIRERGGAIEISIDRRPSSVHGDAGSRAAQSDHAGSRLPTGTDVVWRVKVVSISPTEMLVEPPAAFGASIDLAAGINLIGAMTIGQNRWMFHTRTIGSRTATGPEGHTGRCLVLSAPAGVERCTRRHFYRISTADLQLPIVQCWPLLDPTTVLAAETANRLSIEQLLSTGAMPAGADAEPSLLPDAGPAFQAHLVNMGGGGLGLRIGRNEASAVDRRHHIWLRVDLRPHIPIPVAVTGRLAHTHIDSEQNLYAGLAFDFTYNPPHRAFVLGLFTGYVERLQTLQRRAA